MTISGIAAAQTSQPFQLPPKEILELADIQPRPSIRIDSRNKTMVMLDRMMFKTLEELAETEVKLAGIRINPVTNGQARATYNYGIRIMDIETGTFLTISGLPEKLKISEFNFSPDETRAAFTNTTSEGIELWLLDLKSGKCNRISTNRLNSSLGNSYVWSPASDALYVMLIPGDRKPLPNSLQLPEGPAVQESSGKKAPAWTYQDLLRNPADEIKFEYYTRSEVKRIDLNGTVKDFLPKAIYKSLSFSPDGNHLMVQRIVRPYSYIVPLNRFPVAYDIYRSDGSFLLNFSFRRDLMLWKPANDRSAGGPTHPQPSPGLRRLMEVIRPMKLISGIGYFRWKRLLPGSHKLLYLPVTAIRGFHGATTISLLYLITGGKTEIQ
ncbi:MAG: hypothetical protein FD166_67 [Bacteroidetes bacterium]|nr:MAG: hypothetical protein FD166_67 [Bacteroidota bacterium]